MVTRSSEEYTADSRRCAQFKRIFLVCSILQSNSGWWTSANLHAAYRDRVGTISHRTIVRDLVLLTVVGAVECRTFKKAQTASVFRWSGWPPALY